MLPGNSRVFVRASRLHDELFAGKLVFALQVFADKAPHQRTLDGKGEVVRGFVDRICAKGGFAAGLRLLHRSSLVIFCGLACGFRYLTCTDVWPSRVYTSSPVQSAL